MSASVGDRLQEWFHRVARISALLGGILLFGSAFLISAEVVARKLFNFSFAGADELSGYAYALSMAWGYGLAALRGEHVRVDALRAHLPQRMRCLLDVIAFSVFFGLMSMLIWRGYVVLEESWGLGAKSNTPLSTPIWIPQGVWFVGLVFCTAVLLLLLLRAVAAMMRGDLDAIERLSSPHGKDLSISDAAG